MGSTKINVGWKYQQKLELNSIYAYITSMIDSGSVQGVQGSVECRGSVMEREEIPGNDNNNIRFDI